LRSSAAAFCAFAAAIIGGAIPAFAAPQAHVVASGDSLWSIAGTYHVSVSFLESRNHLTDRSILQLGETIVVADVTARAPRRAHARARVVAVHTHSKKTHSVRATSASGVAAKNAVWVATHSGGSAAPPESENYLIAERLLAFDEKVTHTALRYVGVPYVWGGTSFDGVDCSGFVQAVFEHNGISLPRTADSQFEVGRHVTMSDLEPGDLVFFETYAAGASHVGIYLGGGRFIHASSEGVRIDALAEDYYALRYIGARRLIR
jgi:cell wall-associated NlpC family hydrolase